MDKIVIIGGGTFNHIAKHLSLAAPAFGETARKLANSFDNFGANMECLLILTKMADHNSQIITNEHLETYIENLIVDPKVKIIVMNAAVCDFSCENPSDEQRLSSAKDYYVSLKGVQGKILSLIKEHRPDIVVAGFKTTSGASEMVQLEKSAHTIETSCVDIVLANDLETRNNFIVTKDLNIFKGTRTEMLDKLLEESIKLYKYQKGFEYV